MLIFNTTYLVNNKRYEEWFKWIHESYIPSMLDSGYFEKPQVAQILSNEPQEGASSYSVQFHIANMKLLEAWNGKYAEKFLADFSIKFGEEVLLFSTVLKIIE